MVIVDTTVWIDYLRGVHSRETEWVHRELDRQRLGITDLIFCEVLQGIQEERTFQRVQRELRRLELFEPCDAELAIGAARNFRTLRGHGRTVRKTIDCLIATFCIRENHALLHRDRDFDAFEEILGLLVVHA